MATRDDGRTVELATVPAAAVEDAGARTRDAAVFRVPGTRQRHYAIGRDLHYQNGDDWTEYDLRWQAAPPESGFAFVANAGSYTAYCNELADADTLYRLEHAGHYVEFDANSIEVDHPGGAVPVGAPLNVAGQAQTMNDDGLTRQGRVNWAGGYGVDIDLRLSALERRLAKEIVINAQPAALQTPGDMDVLFRWTFRTDLDVFVNGVQWDGSTVEIADDETVEFRDAADAVMWSWRVPVATDATGGSEEGRLRLELGGNETRAVLAFPLSWFASAEYPVTIDPDTYYGESTDGSINGDNAVYATARSTSAASAAGAASLVLGQIPPGASYGVFRNFLEFDTSGIDQGYEEVIASTLTLTATADNSTDDFVVAIRQCTWDSPIGAGNREANYDAALAGTHDANWRSTSGMAINTPYESNALATTYINRQGMTQYTLMSDQDVNNSAPTNNEYIQVAAQEHATQSYRPQLTITTAAKGEIIETRERVGEFIRIRLQWHATGIVAWHDLEGDVYGTLERFVAYHSDSAVSSTYNVYLYDPLEGDVLVGAGAALSHNTTTEKPISILLAANRRHDVAVGGQLRFKLDYGTEDTHGIFDLYYREHVCTRTDIK